MVSSLSESLKDGVDLFYDFDKKYHSFKPYKDEDTISFSEFLTIGKNKQVERAKVTLDDDFLITYTSGSTIVGLPKEIVQPHRSLVIMGRLHDNDLSGLPKMKDVRMLAHIPTYSNTDVITSISDPLSQGCSVALEPIYDRDFFNSSLVINRPNAVAATRSFWIHSSLTYQKEFPNIKQRGLFIPISVGENTSLGEEKLINKFLKEVKAGQDRLPIPAVLSMGGGDCEHGGIYFSLYHAYKSKLTATSKYGLVPFKGLSQAILDEEGNRITDGSVGRLVAIGPTTMKEYNNNKEATNKFKEVNHDILIPLADHIHFTIKRMDENILPSNPFTYDIRLLFPDEYEVALKSKEIIKSFINKEINNDEVSFITLHIHSAISSNKVGESMEAARVVHESIIKLQTDLNMKIDVESISYARLMNHIKFLIIRLNTNEQLQMDISEFTKNKFPFAYEQAIRMCDNLSKVLHKELPESEIGYLALHLERILSSAFQN